MDVTAYLHRIGLDAVPAPDRDALFALQKAHLTHVPYETMDIIQKREVSLDPEAVFDKVVNRRRGGYCFELNGLFGCLLRELGFAVTEYFGRFLRDEAPGFIPMRRHRVLRVTAEGRDYICDVGVGGVCPLLPLALEEDTEQTDGRTVYRFRRDPFFGWVIQEKKPEGFRDYYGFTEEPQAPIDFEATHYYCCHSPESIFVKSAICAIQTEQGRRTLSAGEFRIFSENTVETYTPQDEKTFLQALDAYFGINID